MNVLQSFLIALEMLRLHKLRAFLTMLGVIIGVMSVTIIVMVSSGFQYFMKNQFNQLGSDSLFLVFDPGRRARGETLGGVDGLTMADVAYLKDRVPQLDVVAPMVQVPAEPVSVGEKDLDNPRIYGIDESYLQIQRVNMVLGRAIENRDVASRANVAMIGTEIRDTLFPGKDPLGQIIVFRGIALEVVGVMEKIDVLGQSNGRDVALPITTAQSKWLGGDKLMMINMRAREGVRVPDAMDAVWNAMMVKSGGKPIYRVDSSESILNVFNAIFGVAGAVLAAIAALALLVGGIGIMNIMLVSVTERTREIGLRKAVGAKRGSILVQFVVEAATLSLVGGLIGMALAYGIGSLVTVITSLNNWPSKGGLPTPFPLVAGVLSAAFSAMIGVVFGLYPAVSAAKLDPIDALRRE